MFSNVQKCSAMFTSRFWRQKSCKAQKVFSLIFFGISYAPELGLCSSDYAASGTGGVGSKYMRILQALIEKRYTGLVSFENLVPIKS
jgi:hypothetical protein